MRLKSSVDRQDKIEFLNFRQTRKNRESVRTKSNYFSCRTISKITEFVRRTDKSIIINNTFCRGLKLPRRKSNQNNDAREEHTQMKATRSKARQDVVNAAKKMPPLFHKLPNEDFDYRKSRTLWWLVKQPQVLKYIWDMVKQSGALAYDDKSHKWHGVDFKCEEEDDD